MIYPEIGLGGRIASAIMGVGVLLILFFLFRYLENHDDTEKN